MPDRVINLGEYSDSGVGVLAGRDRGSFVRERENLDRVDRERVPVQVVIPPEIFSVNSSFFLGMFGKSIRLLGEDEFRRVYHFAPEAEAMREDGIRKALLTGVLRPARASA